ncbi:MAG: hypothetical protein J7K23_00865 [Thermoproteales archaeon]|nr:hypothetical protein [Thermoproteales archaeon]
MVRYISSEKMTKYKCTLCGSPEIMAKINGKYYCFKCGSKIVNEHVRKLIEDLGKKGLIE